MIIRTIWPIVSIFIGTLSIGSVCSAQQNLRLRPQHLSMQDTTVVIEKGDLKVTFANNKPYGRNHWAGYSGISEMYHTAQDSSIFMLNHAGFNLEFIVSGDSIADIFEPRHHPVELYYSGKDEVMLYQTPTPESKVESLTTFKLTAPNYIDVTFRCIVHRSDYFKHGYAGLFWASYIDTPKDKKIYFKGLQRPDSTIRWVAASSGKHAEKSTHKGMIDQHNFHFAPNFNVRLFNAFSDYRYDLPFYYGRFHNMVIAYLFDSSEVIRFAQSPDGGGKNQPAWDFQYLIPDLKIDHEYAFRARIIYKPFISALDMEEEYKSWKK